MKLNKALMAAGLVAGAAISMPSQAVVMSDDGTGEVLIYPFYTVQGPADAPRSTLVTIINNKDEIKAVKVRFHEAHNSRDALDFNLYLSPKDVWTASITRNPTTGVAQLTTTDLSCIIPSVIMNKATNFSTNAYIQAVNNDGGNQTALRTNEGYIEVIEMGVVNPAQLLLAPDAAGVPVPPIASSPATLTMFDAIVHNFDNGIPGGALDSDGIPIGCKALQAAAESVTGVWRIPGAGGNLENAHIAVSQPTGGLSGSGLIAQGTLGTVAAYNATALKHFYDVQSITNAACAAAAAGSAAAFHDGAGLYCETNGSGVATTTTNRAFDDLHSFKDLDPTTANSRSIQTSPNLAMTYPQISTIFDPDQGAAGGHTVLEWSSNETVSTGVTTSKDNILFAAVKDLGFVLSDDAANSISDPAVANNCGGFNGVQGVSAANDICGNARAVSAVFAQNALFNEYVLESEASSGIEFKTDIVVSLPTKWFFSDNGLYSNGNVVNEAGIIVSQIEARFLPPFSSQFVSPAGGVRDGACERFSIQEGDILSGGTFGGLWDREEKPFKVAASGGGLEPSPAINNVAPPGTSLCHEANVITLNDGDLLSSRIANGLDATVENAADGSNSFNIDFPAEFASGWFKIAFDSAGAHAMTSVTGGPMSTGGVNLGVGAAGAAVTGLPALGFVVEGLVSGSSIADGNFTAALPHKKM